MTAEPSQIRLVRAAIAGQHDIRFGYGEIRPVMLAKADGVDADLVGQNTFLDHVADDFGMPFEAAIGVGSDVAEGVEAEFDLLSLWVPYFTS